MKVTLELPEEVAADLRHFQDQSATIIAAGLREVAMPLGGEFHGLAQVMEKLAELPSAEEVLAMRPSTQLESRIRELTRKSREEGLNAEEQREWRRFETVEHLVRMAKGRARKMMAATEAK